MFCRPRHTQDTFDQVKFQGAPVPLASEEVGNTFIPKHPLVLL